jgi:hypothetical protein
MNNMLDKSLMTKGFLFKYTPSATYTPCNQDVILIVQDVLNESNHDCGYNELKQNGDIMYYGHNQFHTFDRFNKINTKRNDIK